jgi:uncharacterized protein
VLARIEHELGRPIADHFDLIAGTSTGGLIALALALRVPAAKVADFYKDKSALIFTRREAARPSVKLRFALWTARKLVEGFPADLDAAALLGTRYEADRLKAALIEVFGADALLGAARTRVVIPSIDIVKGQTVVFKTPHLPGMIRDRHFLAWQIALATAAAPTYFRHATVGKGGKYIDGGLWANNPSLVAYCEAAKIRKDATRDGVDTRFDLSQVRLLSIGTGKRPYVLDPPDDGAGAAFWGRNVLDVLGTSQSQGIDFECQYLLDAQNYDRIDFDLPEGTWSLDAADKVGVMLHKGEEEAVAKLRPKYFAAPAAPFTAF